MYSSFWRVLKHLVTRDEEKVSALNDVWKKMSRLYREVFGLVHGDIQRTTRIPKVYKQSAPGVEGCYLYSVPR